MATQENKSQKNNSSQNTSVLPPLTWARVEAIRQAEAEKKRLEMLRKNRLYR